MFFYGKVERDLYGTGNLQIIQPQFEILSEGEPGESLEVGRVVAIYESLGGLGPRVLRRLMATALAALDGNIPDRLPPTVRRAARLLERARALAGMHLPAKDDPIEKLAAFRTPAQVRLIFEEFFHVAAGLALKRRHRKASPGIEFCVNPRAREWVKRILPFHPTAAQKRVLKEIVDDMRSPKPMNRLLQGDVGSGKTIVAIQAALVAVDNGYQVALMAPTEILATQHYLYIKDLLKPLPIEADLLISARRAAEKTELKRRIAEGETGLVVGTHALLEEDVEFGRLGLVIVDEQHRFGVLQRQALIRKGQTPDVLVMTAAVTDVTLVCPGVDGVPGSSLPLTVADLSAARGVHGAPPTVELPPKRAPIVTRLFGEDERPRAFEFIRDKVRQGEQAFVVYPVIEESSKADLRAAVRMHDEIRRNVFPELRVGLLHGRLPSEEKEAAMRDFKAGNIQVLVSTTVVEVGVDVPNATAMLVEHAERFGLAQLHQLRGRIGRGRGKSFCLLVAGERINPAAAERLRAIAETTDGFKIAELDLKLRGPGEFFGTRQWGVPAFRVANLVRDAEVLEWAKREATDFVERPASKEEFDAYLAFLRQEWPRRYGLAAVA